MAPSLQALIDFLLAEIALCGDQGASPSDILTFIHTFYTESQDAGANKNDNLSPHPTQNVDRRFQEKVWSWLTRHPEVSVGKDKEGNHLTLADVERRAEIGEVDTSQAGIEDIPQDASKKGINEAKPCLDPHLQIRVFVSKERTWLAVTGHEPDETKVLPTEFALLSIIASRKSNGILQTELVKLSGQDKRSVPKRTDMLQRKGYIDKRVIYVKPSRTSLCILRKFSQEKPIYQATQTAADQETAKSHTNQYFIDVQIFVRKFFEILREHIIIARDDLKKALGFADRWRWKFLSRAIRKLERIGVVRRVRAKSQYSGSSQRLHSCVMLVREPSDSDLDMFLEHGASLLANPEQEGNNANDENDEDLELENPTGEASSTSGTEVVGTVKREVVEESGRTLPIWSPDRSIYNLLFDVVDSSGTSGMPNLEIMQICFGGFFRRPVENTLARLVECWQLSQPPHLRHLAIVRDTAVRRTITHYVHYSLRNFKQLVDAGLTSWEAVEFVPKDAKTSKVSIPPVDVDPQVDEYGLPRIISMNGLLNRGDATLLDCVRVAKPADYVLSMNDPVAARLGNGSYAARSGRKNPPNGALNHPTDSSQAQMLLENTLRKPRRETMSHAPPSAVADGFVDEDNAKVTRRKKPKLDPEQFKGMSQKERLAILGLDETYTEYSVLLLDRPTSGVYITPRGRRRPAGKRQGRPRISRIAVFKSFRLSSLPWFVEEETAATDPLLKMLVQEAEPSGHRQTPAPSENLPFKEQLIHETPDRAPFTSSRGHKRNHQDIDVVEMKAVPEITPSSGRKRGRPPKQPRLKGPDVVGVQDVVMSIEKTPESHIAAQTDRQPRITEPTETASQLQSKWGRDLPPKSSKQVAEDSLEDVRMHRSNQAQQSHQEDGHTDGISIVDAAQEVSSSKRPRESGLSTLAGDESLAEPSAQIKALPSVAMPLAKDGSIEVLPDDAASNTTLAIGTAPDVMPVDGSVLHKTAGGTPGEEQQFGGHGDASQNPNAQRYPGRRKRVERGGSVALLRRKTIMDIVEKAGGAFPMGTELWYPFTTMWMKMKFKEKPDMRTIKSTVKHLIDSGKLRQLTFSGKDSRGVMITKNIVTKPDVRPDDPLVKDMQKGMLSAGSGFHFPQNTEMNAELTKSGRRLTPRDPNAPFPIETDMTVRLQNKPAYVLHREQRGVRNAQRRLLRDIQLRAEAVDDETGRPIRLLQIRRAPLREQSPVMNSLTSISRPLRRHEGEKRGPRMRRLLVPMAPYAMLIHPKQTFHASSGTFGTDAGLASLRRPQFTREKRTAAVVTTTLPESLEDILAETREGEADFFAKPDPRSSKFLSENEAILKWELDSQALLRRRSVDLRYINQTVQDSFDAVPIEGAIRFDTDEPSRPSLQELEPKITRQAAHRYALSDIRPATDAFVENHNEPIRPYRQSSTGTVPTRNRRLAKLNESMAALENDSFTGQMASAKPVARRSRPQFVPDPLLKRIMISIAVVRGLAGGVDGRWIDWGVMSKIFPEHEPGFMHDRAKHVLNKNRLQIAKMQSDFQERFIAAYEKDQVPRIDYDNLEGYDWNRVISWATAQLDVPTPSGKMPDLPATREQFDGLFELREETPLSALDDIYQSTQNITTYRKRTLFASVPFAIPLQGHRLETTPRKEKNSYLASLEVAKTWVRANVTTPEELYNPIEARRALNCFGEDIISHAVQSLVTERVILMGNRGRITPGRNYDLTEHFLQTLSRRRFIDSTPLRRAARFKTKALDPVLRTDEGGPGTYEIQYGAEDGDILALINLTASGKVILRPRNPPRDKFGLTEGGYLTRKIEKSKLYFAIEVQPVTGMYEFGNPVQEKASHVPPPRPVEDNTDTNMTLNLNKFNAMTYPYKIPIWFDIHGNFIKVLWDLAVAAVIGSVAIRPGISAAGIASMLKPTMGAWEVQLLLEWMQAVGVVGVRDADVDDDLDRKLPAEERPGWAVQENWWLVLK